MESVLRNNVRRPVPLPPATAPSLPMQAPMGLPQAPPDSLLQEQPKAPPKPKVAPELVAIIQMVHSRANAQQETRLPGNSSRDVRPGPGWQGEGR